MDDDRLNKAYDPEIHKNTSKWIAEDFIKFLDSEKIKHSEIEDLNQLKGELHNFIFVMQKNKYVIEDEDYDIINEVIEILQRYYSAGV